MAKRLLVLVKRFLTLWGLGKIREEQERDREILRRLEGKDFLDLADVRPGQIVNVHTSSDSFYRFMVSDLKDGCLIRLLEGNVQVFHGFPLNCNYDGGGTAGVGFFRNRIVYGVGMVFTGLPKHVSEDGIVTTSTVKTWWLETS